MTGASVHDPVMVAEVVQALAPRDGGVYVDGTFGGGGYSRAVLAAAACTVWAIDRDADAIARGADLAAASGGRLHLVPGRFGDMDRLLAERGVAAVDGVALDLGVSSDQIDTATRGFSFMRDGPLDMRMGAEGETAADTVNTAPEAELAAIIGEYGEERHARRIARAIVAARSQAPITRTHALAEIVRRVVPRGGDAIDPATRTFQGLRIHVNDELGELRRGLASAERILAAGARLVVVSFHSLEDRLAKAFLRARSGGAGASSRHAPGQARASAPASFKLLARRALRPSPEEAARNPRARSAKLRAAERLATPPWAQEAAA